MQLCEGETKHADIETPKSSVSIVLTFPPLQAVIHNVSHRLSFTRTKRGRTKVQRVGDETWSEMVAERSRRGVGRADSEVKSKGFDEAPGFSAQGRAIIWPQGGWSAAGPLKWWDVGRWQGVDGVGGGGLGVWGEGWRALNSKQHPLTGNPPTARQQRCNGAEITEKETISISLLKFFPWWSEIVLTRSRWLSLACFFPPNLHGGHFASWRPIHYLFVYRPQLPAPPFDVIWAIFSQFSFFYVILLFPHSLFGPELFLLFFFSLRSTHFSLFIFLAVYFIMQETAKQKFT